MSDNKVDAIKRVLEQSGVDLALNGALLTELLKAFTGNPIENEDPETARRRKFTLCVRILSNTSFGPMAPIIAKKLMDDDNLGGGSVAKLSPKPKPGDSGAPKSYDESNKGGLLGRLRSRRDSGVGSERE
jgi:hypothetical protein